MVDDAKLMRTIEEHAPGLTEEEAAAGEGGWTQVRGKERRPVHGGPLLPADGPAPEEGSSGLVLVLYMTYQPCHHSGGRVPKMAGAGYAAHAPEHPATCSERLRDFYLRKLKPRGVSLELVLADVYKATWEEELHPSEVERRVYATKAESVREGMRMLLSHNNANVGGSSPSRVFTKKQNTKKSQAIPISFQRSRSRVRN